MVDELPGNSRRATSQPFEKREASDPPPKAEPIEGLGRVVRRKKPFGRKFRETFFAGTTEGEGVIVTVTKQVLLPAMQNLVTDMVSELLYRTVYGSGARPPRRGNDYRSTTVGRPHISYDRPSILARPADHYDEVRAARARRPLVDPSSVDLDEVVLESRVAAQRLAEGLYERLEEFGSVSVAFLYESLRMSSTHTDHRFGWADLSSMEIRPVRGGYLLDLPRPVDLDAPRR